MLVERACLLLMIVLVGDVFLGVFSRYIMQAYAQIVDKTLTYDDGSKPVSASFNYSNQVPVQELTRLFQDMSSTLEFARRLNFYYRYQKLALDAELKRMEELAKGNGLAELQAAEPILRQIADDPSVINVVRARAKGLTERIAR